MPTTAPDNLSDVRNWPNLVFKFLISCLGGLIFILGTALYGEVSDLNENLGNYRETQNLNIKDQGYLKDRVISNEASFFKHVERAEQQDLEQDRRIDRLEYHIKTK